MTQPHHPAHDADRPEVGPVEENVDPAVEEEIQRLEPPDPIDEEDLASLDLFAAPPPLPQPMLVLDGDLPPSADPEPDLDHGTCSCGGKFDADGWCTECGNPRPNPRDHFTEQVGARLAGACDRGLRHQENQDALALWGAQDAPDRSVLVVCDGVTTATRSGEASIAAAEAAVTVLAETGRSAAERVVASTDAAMAAVARLADDHPGASPSCTFVAGVIEEAVATVGSVGDSRAYWLPDEGAPKRLTADDSMAEEQVRSGVDRATAEAGPLAHTITRWIGPDAPDHTPVVVTQDVREPGWLLLCSDGLWNYASEAADLAAVLRAEQRHTGVDPLALSLALVEWAKGRGGADNITVALARTGPEPQAGVGPEETSTTRQDGNHG